MATQVWLGDASQIQARGILQTVNGGTGADLSAVVDGDLPVGKSTGTEFQLLNVAANQTMLTPDSADAMKVGWRSQGITGEVRMFAFGYSNADWLACDGSAVSRSTYSALFAAIGTAYGVGDGSTTFNLPDVQGRVPIGSGNGAGLTGRTRGDTGGVEAVALTQAQVSSNTFSSIVASAAPPTAPEYLNGDVHDANGGTAHQNMQPFAVLSYFIRV